MENHNHDDNHEETTKPKEKKVVVHCPEDGCDLIAHGYDIEKAYDDDNEPIWAIFYQCPDGHRFVAEYHREIEIGVAP